MAPREISIAEGNNSYDEEELEALAKAEEAGNTPDRNPTNPLFTEDQRCQLKSKFLEYLATGMSITKAVNTINGKANNGVKYSVLGDGIVTRKTFYVWRRFDKQFAKDWDEAFEMGTDALEDVGHGYALEGNAALIQFLLRVRNPKRYAMNRHEVSGPGGGPVPVSEVTRTIIDPSDPDRPDAVPGEVPDDKAE